MTIILKPNDDLDRALRMARTPGDVIIAQDGNFTTAGNWAFPDFRSLAAGVRLDVTGSTIRFSKTPWLTTNGTERIARDLNILWAGANTEVIGGTWDCTPPAGWHGGGLRFGGTFSLRDATITGLIGSRMFVWNGNVGVEVFGVSSEGNTGGSHVIGVTIKDVARGAYVSGIYLGGTLDPGDKESFVQRCTVDLGADNQHAFSSSYQTTFDVCRGQGGRYGFYSDTGPCFATLRECSLSGSWAAISMVGTQNCTRSVVVTGSDLTGERCVEWWDKTPSKVAMIGGVIVYDCHIDSHWLAATSARQGTIALVENSIVQGKQFCCEGIQPFIA